MDTTPLSCFCFAVAVERITRPGGVFLEARAKVSLFRFGVVGRATLFIYFWKTCGWLPSVHRYCRTVALVTQKTRDSFSSKKPFDRNAQQDGEAVRMHAAVLASKLVSADKFRTKQVVAMI